MDVQARFEEELRRRGIAFSINAASGRHVVEMEGRQLLVSLDNLKRDVERNADSSLVSQFVDAIFASPRNALMELSPDRLYWNLEPNDYVEPANFHATISKKVDRVLVYLSDDHRLITWVTPSMLEQLRTTRDEAENAAYANLALALADATLTTHDIDVAKLGMLETKLPFKTAFILAPNLKQVVGGKLGWPLLAVAPDRDFLFLWDASHKEFLQRIGGVVVKEFEQASYPISTEVYELSDAGIRAIGEFPSKPRASST